MNPCLTLPNYVAAGSSFRSLMMSSIAGAGAHRAHELSSLARARQIAAVLARHHLWHLIELMALEHLVPIGHQRAASGQTFKMVAPEDVRQALEELGPTFMKLGQVLSTRADLLPPEFQAESAQLQDRAPVVPSKSVIAIIEAELGQPVESSFATFERTPLATGSIGQAHLAMLADGTEVLGVILAALVIAVGFLVSVYRPGAQVGLVGTFLAGALGAAAVVVARLLWLATRKPPN